MRTIVPNRNRHHNDGVLTTVFLMSLMPRFLDDSNLRDPQDDATFRLRASLFREEELTISTGFQLVDMIGVIRDSSISIGNNFRIENSPLTRWCQIESLLRRCPEHRNHLRFQHGTMRHLRPTSRQLASINTVCDSLLSNDRSMNDKSKKIKNIRLEESLKNLRVEFESCYPYEMISLIPENVRSLVRQGCEYVRHWLESYDAFFKEPIVRGRTLLMLNRLETIERSFETNSWESIELSSSSLVDGPPPDYETFYLSELRNNVPPYSMNIPNGHERII